MGYPGYPQQNWQQGGYYPPGPPPTNSGSPALAVIAGIVGLVVAGVLATQTFLLLSDVSEAPELPGGWTAMVVLHFVVAGVALLGAVLVFARQVVGAFLLLVAAVLTVAVLVLDPAMAEGVWASMLGALPEFDPSGDYGNYFKAMMEFGNEQATLRFIALVLGVILLVIAALPPSLRWLRGSRPQGYSGYPQGW
jgi:hypothetical protein